MNHTKQIGSNHDKIIWYGDHAHLMYQSVSHSLKQPWQLFVTNEVSDGNNIKNYFDVGAARLEKFCKLRKWLLTVITCGYRVLIVNQTSPLF